MFFDVFQNCDDLIFRDSSPSSAMGEDNSTRYLQEMTLLLREQFPYSSIYPVLGDMDFNPRGQAQAKADPMYKVASDLWGTWLPPKAIDSLKHGEKVHAIHSILLYGARYIDLSHM